MTAFLNRGPRVTDVARLDITQTPVRYKFIGADLRSGADLYRANCMGCHGANGKKQDIGRGGGIIDYFRADGKYSEGFHKIIYGADDQMTREKSGNLTAEQARDLLAWIQSQADRAALTGLGQ